MKATKTIQLGLGLALIAGLAAAGPFAGPKAHAQNTDPATPAAQAASAAASNSTAEPATEHPEPAEPGPESQRLTQQEVVKVWGDAVLPKGQSAPDVVGVFGSATADGDVKDAVVAVFGNATANGTVGGDVVAVFGSVKLGPEARVKGDVVSVFGKLDISPQATVKGMRTEVGFPFGAGEFPQMTWLKDWLKSGLLLGRPLPPGVGWVWWIVAIHFVVYLLIAVVLPKPVEACVKTLEAQLLPAFFAGLLGLILYVILMFILLMTGLGIFIMPFVWIAFVAARYVGKTATFQFLGDRLLRRFGLDTTERPLLSFATGSAMVTLLYMVPFVGFLVWGVLRILGLGVALMTVFAAFRRNGKGGNGAGYVLAAPVPAANPPSLSGSALAGDVPSASAVVGGPSAVEVAALPRVGFWLRLAATLLDLVLLGWLAAHFDGLWVLLWVGYHIAMWTWKGTTIGGIVCGIKVVRVDGRPLDFTVSLVRGLAAVFSGIALGLGFFWAGWTREKQSWHDKIAGTTIVKLPKGVSLV